MLPSEAFHVTDLLAAAPSTTAENRNVLFAVAVVDPGDITMELTATGAAITVTEADADLLGSATLVAVIM
jgi:hypothetical protein